MQRAINTDLLAWKKQQDRKPLLIRGARQVGKSYAVREFVRKNFNHFVEINFELEPKIKKIFADTLDPLTIIKELAIILNQPIEIGSTLLFLDEIQSCPQAITALRYFYEKLPELHVIAAGSLIEFALESEKISMPVGRIQSLYMHPLSFEEFLLAREETLLRDFIFNEADLTKPIGAVIHDKGMSLVKEYALIGGMPAAVAAYIKAPEQLNYRPVQQGLLQTFTDDFGKYARTIKHKYLETVYLSAPALISKDYKYSHVDRDTPSRALKEALSLLEKAGVVTRIRATSGAGLPLEAYADERRLKIAFLDIGLVQAALGLDAKIALAEDFIAINAGALAEQFVAQELIATSSPFERSRLYFWARNKRGSTAEVDFLYQNSEHVFPLEVKAGATGKLKSLRSFLGEHKAPFGIRISAHPLGLHEGILSVPFYLTPALKRLVVSAKISGKQNKAATGE